MFDRYHIILNDVFHFPLKYSIQPTLLSSFLLFEQYTNHIQCLQSIRFQIMNHSISTMSGKTKLKIIFLGNQSVGKTCIIDKYINDRFEQTANTTVGIDFLAKNISHNAKNYRLQLWDTAGQERFRSLIPGYLKDAHCALIVFDVASKASFADVETWIKLYTDNRGGDGFLFLVGNKVDKEYRQVTTSEGMEKANKLGFPYFQISAKTGENIHELFSSIIQMQSDKTISGSKFLPQKREVKPVEIVKQQKQEEDVKPSVEQTGARIKPDSVPPVSVAENIVLKNESKVQSKEKKKKQQCC